MGNKVGATLAIGAVSLVTVMAAGWVTHVVWVIKVLMSPLSPTTAQMALAIIGAVAPPVGSIHGIYLWFS